MHSLVIRAGVLFGLGLLAGAGARWAEERYAPTGRLPGLTVDGALVPTGPGGSAVGPAELRAFVESRASALRSRRVQLRIGAEGAEAADLAGPSTTLGDLGVTVDVDAVVRRVTALQEEGDVLMRARLVREAKAGRIDVPLSPEVTPAVLLPIVSRFKERTDLAPVSARLDLEHRTVIREHDGLYLDPWGSIEAVRAAALDPNVFEITLPDTRFPARHTSELLSKLDVHTVLGEYDTYFSRQGEQRRRGQNIDVAASKIDGLVMLPGEIVSFNSVVGERSEENGFAKSWEIFKGEMVEGIGGGTCQVASTFHAAAFFGGLDVLERLPHSRPSAYIPMGLDATVVYPIVDLKIRNPFDFAVVMHAKVDGNRLHMELLGTRKVARVAFARELVETFPYKRKVTEEPKLSWSKRIVLKQHGIRGFKIKRSRTLYFEGGRSKKETNTDTYPSTTEIYEVPPGFDPNLLPPLPEDDKDDKDDDTPAPAAAPAGAPAASAPAGAPVASASPAAPPGGPPPAIVLADGTTLDVQVAPGAHVPTAAQSAPAKTVSITR